MGKLMRLPDILDSALTKAINFQQSLVAGYVARLCWARPTATPAEVIALLEKRYLAAVTSTGAAVGVAAAVPGLGTGVALALSGSETVVFIEATALFALSVAEVHSIQVEEVERRRMLVLTVVLGDQGATLVEKVVGRTGQHWVDLLPDKISSSSIGAINQTLGQWFLTKYGQRQAVRTLGKLMPFGIGTAAGGAGNRAFGHLAVNTSRRVFGPAPASFTNQNRIRTINGRTNGLSPQRRQGRLSFFGC
jgi:hypothetical protein